mgnify:CR=1 FL=1
MITVANIRTTKQGEYIGRAMPRQRLVGSPLGNPYRLTPGVARWVPIAQYRDWLKGQLTADTPQRREFDRLVALARQGDLTLLCWCAPQSCHGDVVAELIRAELERGNP